MMTSHELTSIKQRTLSVHLIIALLSAFVLARAFLNTTFRLDTPEEKSLARDSSAPSSPCNEYRSYPWPEHHSGLPLLADVFASHDAQWVYFIAVNRGVCQEKYLAADAFQAEDRVAHRFICAFPDGNLVWTEFIHASPGHGQGFVIRCRIPENFQSMVASPQNFTSLHVHLHATEDLEMTPVGPANIKLFPSVAVNETPKLADLAVCHPVTHIPTKKFNLTVFTRLTSTYMDINTPVGVNATLSPLPLLMEWMDYHHRVGVDHFIIYDNDKEPHGPIETLLQPFVEAGLATYVWFPLPDCTVEYGGWQSYRSTRGQVGASLAALHRYGFTTTYFGHMDVDEYFIPLNHMTLLELLEEEVDPSYDVTQWRPYRMAPCNGTTIRANDTAMNKWRCFSGEHYADIKLIFRPERMMNFFIHYPLVTMDGMSPTVHAMNDTTQGFLAHYRRAPHDLILQDAFEGVVDSPYTELMHFMDRFVGESS